MNYYIIDIPLGISLVKSENTPKEMKGESSIKYYLLENAEILGNKFDSDFHYLTETQQLSRIFVTQVREQINVEDDESAKLYFELKYK